MQASCWKCRSPATGRFCAHCGSPILGGAAAGRERRARWAAALGSLLVTVLLIVLVLREKSTAAAAAEPASSATPGTPPDLSTLTSRERFDRLYRRVMGAAQTGDTVTVARFAPMVFAAYAQLDTVDADARYHAALLHLHLQNDTAAALRLADSILVSNPRHLFGFLIQGTAAQLAGDQPLLARARSAFLAAWDRELQADRIEYREHQTMLDQFRATARLSLRRAPPAPSERVPPG
jgi:hypothetical protein